MTYGDHRFPFPQKTRRCRHFGDDGRVKRDPCPQKSIDCHFVHPDDPEWMETPIYFKKYADMHRDRRSSSRYDARGRDYSPGRRDGGWGDRDGVRSREGERERERDRERGRGRDGSRSKERRRAYPSPTKVKRESSIASSRSDAAATTDISSTPVLPTEPAALRASKAQLRSPVMDHRVGKPSPSGSISINTKANFMPQPPSLTPPLPPLPPPSADPVRSPAVPRPWPTTVPEPITPSTAASDSGFTLPPPPPSTGASTSSFTVPPPPSAVSTTSSIPPSTATSIPPLSASSTETLQREQRRTPIFIKSLKPVNLHPPSAPPSDTPSPTIMTGISSPKPGELPATAAPNTPAAPSTSNAAQAGAVVSTGSPNQPPNIDTSMPPASSFDAIPGLSPSGVTPTVQTPLALPIQSQPQSLPPVPPLPPLPNFEYSETMVPELSNEAKIELWNKRTKAMAEILRHNEKALRLTSDIDDLKRYSISPFFSSDPDEKKRIETNIAELEANRESAQQAMQEGLDALVGSDTWPSAPLVEKVQNENEKMKEYVVGLADVMRQVGETLKELAEIAGVGAGKARRRKRKEKGNEKEKEKEKDAVVGKEKETVEEKEPLLSPDAMVVDEVSPTTETKNVTKQSILDDGDETLVQPENLDEIRAKFTSLSELWQSVSDSLDQAESSWTNGVKEMYQDLVLTQKHTIRSRIEQHKSQVDQHAAQLKSELSQVDAKVDAVGKNVDGVVDETAQALEKILRLREERNTLLADHQKFFKEELPSYQARFAAYDAQKKKDQKRFIALEAALNAYVNQPPSPVVGISPNMLSSFSSLDTLASTGSTSSLPTSMSASSMTVSSSSSTTNTNSSQPNTRPGAPDYSLVFQSIKPQLINLLRVCVKPLVEEMRRQVEEMMNAQKEEMYANMWNKIEFTWQLLTKVQKTAEADIGALLASANPNGNGGGSKSGENGAAVAADVIMSAVRDTPISASHSGPPFAAIPMDISVEPGRNVSAAPAAASTRGRGVRGDSGGSMSTPNASSGGR